MGPMEWLENTPLGLWVSSSLWGYPFVLSSHAVGMAVLAGVALMFSLRALGWASGVPVTSLAKYMRIAKIGFVINLLSGVALFIGAASEMWLNWPFRIKIVLIFAGLALTSHLAKVCMGGPGEVTQRHKTIAAAAGIVWIGVLIAGRLIAYVD